jgi:hypothetical protein
MLRQSGLLYVGVLTASMVLSGRALAAEPAPGPKPIDVAICLDVSNSMDNLIGSAKKKLWDIVNDLAKAKPTPFLRVALYSYGNDGYDPRVGWVRKELDLTTDLDKVSEKLFGLTTRGGTEYVARVTRDALAGLNWSTEKDALKIIFVCGNEPADQDKEIHLRNVAQTACRQGVIVNTIYCGNINDADARTWREFATMAEGRFASIDQDRGTVVMVTPVDKELSTLSTKLNETYLFYGAHGKERAANQVLQDANAVQAGVASSRAISKGSPIYRNDDVDLVDRIKAQPSFDLKSVPKDELPEALQKLAPAEREAYVKEMLARRVALQKQLSELGKQREEFIQKEMKKNPSKADQAFDEAVRQSLREQAKSKGIEIP